MDNYTAMCDCKEIKEHRIIAGGERYFDPNHNETFCIDGVDQSGESRYKTKKDWEAWIKKGSLVWLPRQEDWQRLILPKYMVYGSPSLYMHKAFLDFWDSRPCLFETLVEYWCAFYMMLFHKKTWKNGAWE